jgi:hypothetical protein
MKPWRSTARGSLKYTEDKEAGTKEAPVDVKEDIQAMDFFHVLDQGRYGVFKTSMLNGWAAKAFDPPKTMNEIYRVAATWVKPTTRIEGGELCNNRGGCKANS